MKVTSLLKDAMTFGFWVRVESTRIDQKKTLSNILSKKKKPIMQSCIQRLLLLSYTKPLLRSIVLKKKKKTSFFLKVRLILTTLCSTGP